MSIEIMSLVIFISGVFIILYGMFFAPTKEEEKILSSSLEIEQVERRINALQTNVNSADKILLELDKFSEHITGEMESKYKELLFLYQMIDEKEQNLKGEKQRIEDANYELIRKQEIAKQEEYKRLENERIELEKIAALNSQKANNRAVYFEMPKANVSMQNNFVKETVPAMANKTMFDEVVYMYESGYNVDDIAKSLNKGKGEIRLMLDLMGKEG